MIIPGSWIFSTMFCFPAFLIRNVKRNVCQITWLGWLSKTYHWMWFVLVIPSLALMVGVYSRVVHTLWFKSNDDNPLTYEQRVGVTEYVFSRYTSHWGFSFGLCMNQNWKAGLAVSKENMLSLQWHLRYWSKSIGGWAGGKRGWVSKFWAFAKGWVIPFLSHWRGWVMIVLD